MISEDGEPLLCDFGLALVLPMGTPSMPSSVPSLRKRSHEVWEYEAKAAYPEEELLPATSLALWKYVSAESRSAKLPQHM